MPPAEGGGMEIKMKNKNSCYTYFRIVGNFEPDEITEILGIEPYEIQRIGDRVTAKGPQKAKFAYWHFGLCDEYASEITKQMEKTIELLKSKSDIINKIRKKYDVGIFLEVVPTVYVNEYEPNLAPSLEVIDFCYKTGVEIDIDLYVMDTEDEYED